MLNATAATQIFRIVTLGFLAGGGDSYPFPADVAANVIDLEEEGVTGGIVDFADNGTEQDALSEFLFNNFLTTGPAFNEADVDAQDDTRIQNLSIVPADTILP